MLSAPKVGSHPEQPYMAIVSTVSQDEIATKLPPLIGEVKAWLDQHHIDSDMPPFFRYQAWKDNNRFEVAVGIPVKEPVKGDGYVQGGTFPAGKFAYATHTGDFKYLRDAHMQLVDWMEKNQLKEQYQLTKDGKQVGTRIEFYMNDPTKIPNPEEWKTDIVVYLGADDKQ